jgi:hypothetical protein
MPSLPNRFPLGRTLSTPAALACCERHGISPQSLLCRHGQGDWGGLCVEDQRANEVALQSGGRLMSSYQLGPDRIWIITEADRSATTLLLPEEY